MRLSPTIAVFFMVAVVVSAASSQPAPGKGLSVPEARASRLPGVLLVRGYIVVNRGGRIRLCERAVRKRPSCRGTSLILTRVSVSQLGPLQHSMGVSWSAHPRAVIRSTQRKPTRRSAERTRSRDGPSRAPTCSRRHARLRESSRSRYS